MKTLLLSVAILFGAYLVNAQTSVYVCAETGAYGYCSGSNDVSSCAYNKCIDYGGKSPYSILSVYSKGYGAIAVGKSSDGAQVVGAAAGYKTSEEAKIRAKQKCINRGGQNVYVDDTFLDE